MPQRRFAVAILAPDIRPIGAGEHVRRRALVLVFAKDRIDLGERVGRQARRGDRSHQDMAFAAPGEGGGGRHGDDESCGGECFAE